MYGSQKYGSQKNGRQQDCNPNGAVRKSRRTRKHRHARHANYRELRATSRPDQRNEVAIPSDTAIPYRQARQPPRGCLKTPSPLVGEGWGEGSFPLCEAQRSGNPVGHRHTAPSSTATSKRVPKNSLSPLWERAGVRGRSLFAKRNEVAIPSDTAIPYRQARQPPRGCLKTPSPLVGEGWGEGSFPPIPPLAQDSPSAF